MVIRLMWRRRQLDFLDIFGMRRWFLSWREGEQFRVSPSITPILKWFLKGTEHPLFNRDRSGRGYVKSIVPADGEHSDPRIRSAGLYACS